MEKEIKLGLGTAALGRPQYINIRQRSVFKISLNEFRTQGLNLLQEAYDKGIRYFDTAPGYGMAEPLMIDWIGKNPGRDIEISTKWGYTYVANFDPDAEIHEVKEHSPKKLDEQWKQSQALLPKLTTYQIHSATFDTGVLENERILNRLFELKLDQGLLIGLTTTGSDHTEVLKKALDVEIGGQSLFDTFQLTYNVFDQSAASDALDLARQGKRLIVKEAMANGRIFPNERYPHYAKTYQILERLATKYGVGVDAIALRFCLDSIPVYRVLSGASASYHLRQNLKVLSFQLNQTEIEDLKSLRIDPDAYWSERKKLTWN